MRVRVSRVEVVRRGVESIPGKATAFKLSCDNVTEYIVATYGIPVYVRGAVMREVASAALCLQRSNQTDGRAVFQDSASEATDSSGSADS